MHLKEIGSATGAKAVHTLGEVAKEKEKTKRWSFIAALVLCVVSGCIIAFAPKDREIVSYIVSAIAGIVALGCLGYSVIRVKTKFVEFWTQK